MYILNSNKLDKPALYYTLFMARNTDWQTCQAYTIRYYFYENPDDYTTYHAPSPYCIVEVLNATGNRGIAKAYAWNNGANGKIWICCLHDVWNSWILIND